MLQWIKIDKIVQNAMLFLINNMINLIKFYEKIFGSCDFNVLRLVLRC